ncbi:sulfotransferase [Wenzhouxiangella marina]|uniref:Uncharacterized protein n=1 Tax=Wenzhouxiangella marina TaxID=1579979 RepID=A0A0K0XV25_9GAMM|nr:sulfotransferase [Wenzhouxiangella marina]AKS41533.1 hypothetical protein WM2015_1159 [Wenzhouxiangella marina]MBB6086708.1 hypothetical protein [Wenzhouxiangella marina]
MLQAGRPGLAWLAGLETRQLTEEIAANPPRAPIFIAGVARSGSTILLQALASLPGLASPRYRDYPPVWLPYWWDRLRQQLPLPSTRPKPRAHADGIDVTPDSPEALDEIFWMHFFPRRHDPGLDQRLGPGQERADFTAFYRAHISKLLHTRGAERYLCKGNYNLLRLPLLLRMFPDARLVVPIRSPYTQVPSLLRQHRRFSMLSQHWPSVARQLARSGHFEFGPQRRAECAGDLAEAQRIEAEFSAGDDLAAYARQWASSYGALADCLSRHDDLAEAVLLVHHEQLCSEPETTLNRLSAHCRLDHRQHQQLLETWPARLRSPSEGPPLSSAERDIITAHCAGIADHFACSSTP